MSLIAIDLDGTLLKDDHQTIDEDTKNLLLQLHKKGHHVVIATGRMLGTSIHLKKSLGFDCDMICSNGAIVHNTEKGIFLDSAMSKEQVSKFLDIMEDPNNYIDGKPTYYHAYSAFDMFANIEENTAKYYKERITQKAFDEKFTVNIGNVRKNIENQRIYKFGIRDDGSEFVTTLLDKILKIGNLQKVASMPLSKDIMKSKVNKWVAIENLCRLYNINTKDTICFGNEENDIQMISKAGIGVAMANSTKDLLKIARNVTYSNEEKGVYEFLKNLDL